MSDMWYLFFQMWLWILIAFVLGWVAHWFLCCRNKDCESNTKTTVSVNSSETIETPNPAPTASASVASAVATSTPKSGSASGDSASGSASGGVAGELNDNWKPVGLSAAPSDPDDLKRIKGIGAVNEKALNGLGIYNFSQIADWTADNISWVEGFLAFPGRIGREDWVEQAKTLAQGGTTSFAQKVDSGKVDYDS
jgi:NADH-quinone oxidoreductase subunit E